MILTEADTCEYFLRKMKRYFSEHTYESLPDLNDYIIDESSVSKEKFNE